MTLTLCSPPRSTRVADAEMPAMWANADPFDLVAAFLPTWTVVVTRLDDVMGCTCVPERQIWLDVRLTARQRRCTLAHEVLHALYGHTAGDERDEARVVAEVARLLVPAHQLSELLAGTGDLDQVAEDLNIDVGVLRTRIRDLYGREAQGIIDRLTPTSSGG